MGYRTYAALDFESASNLTCVILFVPQNNCDVLKPPRERHKIVNRSWSQGLARAVLPGRSIALLKIKYERDFL
jgi:hypothetical protein